MFCVNFQDETKSTSKLTCNHMVVSLRPRKQKFTLSRPTLFYGPDPTDFIGKFVYTELKGQYKTVKPLSGDCKNAGH